MSRIRLPYPHAGQQAVMRTAKRHNWLSAGRRWRKTTLAMSLCAEAAYNGGQYIWGAPTYQQVRIGFDETRRAARGVADFNTSRMEATFPGGGIIYYRSLDNPDNARGYTADGVVIDESGDVSPESWHEVLRPMLIDTNGWSWAIGTPKGRNWWWRECMASLDRHDSMFWQIPTKGCAIVDGQLIRKPHPYENPDIPFSEIVHLFETLPQRTFEQEILAQFLEGEGAVFRNINNCIKADPSTPEPHAGHRIIAGADWAKQADYSAFSFGCMDCKMEVDKDRFNQIDYTFQVERLRTLCQKWRPQAILTELNSIGQPVFEALQRMGLPVHGFTTTASSKPPLIENMSLAFERAEWQFLPDPIWTGELEAYERVVSPTTGRSQYNAPAGMHDDTVIARALMLWQAQQPVTMQVVPAAVNLYGARGQSSRGIELGGSRGRR